MPFGHARFLLNTEDDRSLDFLTLGFSLLVCAWFFTM